MTPKQIKAKLKKMGVKNTAIARELGLSNTAVYKVISHGNVSFRVQSYVASLFNMTVHEVFPNHYGPDCQRRKAGMPLAKIN